MWISVRWQATNSHVLRDRNEDGINTQRSRRTDRSHGGHHVVSPGHVWRLLCQYPACGAFAVAHVAGEIDITMGNSFRFVFAHAIPFILDINDVSLRAISILFYELTDPCNPSEYSGNKQNRSHVRREGLALSIGPNWVSSTWRWRHIQSLEIRTSSIDWAQLSRFHLKMETYPVSGDKD
jgi:hypothetical protein